MRRDTTFNDLPIELLVVIVSWVVPKYEPGGIVGLPCVLNAHLCLAGVNTALRAAVKQELRVLAAGANLDGRMAGIPRLLPPEKLDEAMTAADLSRWRVSDLKAFCTMAEWDYYPGLSAIRKPELVQRARQLRRARGDVPKLLPGRLAFWALKEGRLVFPFYWNDIDARLAQLEDVMRPDVAYAVMRLSWSIALCVALAEGQEGGPVKWTKLQQLLVAEYGTADALLAAYEAEAAKVQRVIMSV